MFLKHVQTRVDGRSNYFWICTPTSTPDFGPRAVVHVFGKTSNFYGAWPEREPVFQIYRYAIVYEYVLSARSRCRWSVSGGRACGTLRECHRLVDGASERLVGARDCSAVRVSAAAAAQIVLQPVVWPPTGGHAQLVAGAIETGQAAGEGVLGLARANRPRRHVATRRGAPARRIASMDVSLDMLPW